MNIKYKIEIYSYLMYAIYIFSKKKGKKYKIEYSQFMRNYYE